MFTAVARWLNSLGSVHLPPVSVAEVDGAAALRDAAEGAAGPPLSHIALLRDALAARHATLREEGGHRACVWRGRAQLLLGLRASSAASLRARLTVWRDALAARSDARHAERRERSRICAAWARLPVADNAAAL
eukprot:gene9028-20550_t